MSESCPSLELLLEIAEQRGDDRADEPRRRHLERCPRCQARLADYRDFLAGGAPCPPAELKAAMAGLDRSLRETVHGPAAEQRRPRASILRLDHPLLRGALAVAALFLLLISLDVLPRKPLDRTIRLRAGSGLPAPAAIQANPPHPTPDGGLEFSWQPVAGADDYEMRLLAPDLTVLDRRSSAGAARMRLEAAELSKLYGEGQVLVWQVEARAGTDPLVASAPMIFALPDRP